MASAPRARGVWIVAGGLVLAITAALGGAPYLYAEYALRQHGSPVGPLPKQSVRGQWTGGYYLTESIDASTFAIGEPRYYQGNYSYLILGANRAVLFDAGTGNSDIVPVVRSLTSLPVTVIPSHLHFDHVGALGRFERTALVDLPELRTRSRHGPLTLDRYEFLGFADRLPTPSFPVDEWWRPGTSVDLGGRPLLVIHTPGHTPTSVSLYDAERRQLFCGDFIYPGMLYAFLPGASRHAYLSTTARLLTALDPATRLYTAHMADEPTIVTAPVLEMADLFALETTLVAVEGGTTRSTGFYPRVFPVRGAIKFGTGFAWNNR